MKWVPYEPKAKMRVLDHIFPDGIQIPDYFFGKNIVHLPTVKCHIYTTTTGAMKNAFGGLLEHATPLHAFVDSRNAGGSAGHPEGDPQRAVRRHGRNHGGNGPGPRTMYPVVKDVHARVGGPGGDRRGRGEDDGLRPDVPRLHPLRARRRAWAWAIRAKSRSWATDICEGDLGLSRRRQLARVGVRRLHVVRSDEALPEAVLSHAARQRVHPRPARCITTTTAGRWWIAGFLSDGPSRPSGARCSCATRRWGRRVSLRLIDLVHACRPPRAFTEKRADRGRVSRRRLAQTTHRRLFLTRVSLPHAPHRPAQSRSRRHLATSSAICYLDGDRGVLAYCGYDIHDLADHASFEEVCFLLWHRRLPTRAELGDLQSQFAANRALPDAITRLMRTLPAGDGMDLLRTLTSALSHYDADATDHSPQANYRKAVRLTAQLGTLVATMGRMKQGRGARATGSGPRSGREFSLHVDRRTAEQSGDTRVRCGPRAACRS